MRIPRMEVNMNIPKSFRENKMLPIPANLEAIRLQIPTGEYLWKKGI